MPFRHLPELLALVEPIGRVFRDSGWRLYLVGGAVRDAWLDRVNDPDDDIDVTTDARPEQILATLDGWADAVWTQGERFGTIGCRKDGRDYEITTHRAEVYDPDSRKPTVSYADAVETDLSRRDFTVNAMAVELPSGDLHDPFDGVEDLRASRLRTPLAAEVSFNDDPLRMLRAARFVAGYGLDPDGEVVAAITDLRERLKIVSVERCQAEVDKLLAVDDPTRGLALLVDTGLAEHVLPGLAGLSGWALESLSTELVALPKGRLRLAALIMAIAPGRERKVLSELRYPNDESKAVERIARAVDSMPEPTAEAASLRRWVHAAGAHRRAALVLARAKADAVGRRPELVDELEASLADLAEREDLDDFGPPVDGARVMRHLGIDAGPTVGEALDMLTEHRLDHGPLTSQEAEALLTTWWQAREG